MAKKTAQFINKFVVWFFLIGTSLFVLYPLVYVVSAAFSSQQNIAALSVVPFGDGIALSNFEFLFKKTDYLIWFKNTLFVAISTMLLTILVCALNAYVFSRFTFRLKKE